MARSSLSVGKTEFRSRQQGSISLFQWLFLFACLLLSLGGAFAFLTLHHPLKNTTESIIHLREGDGALALAKLIRPVRPNYLTLTTDQLVLSVLARGYSLKAGEYDLKASPTLWSLVQAIHSGRTYTRSITFIEGWTFRQWQEALRHAPGIRADPRAVDSRATARELAPQFDSIEGLLMAETYFYQWGDSDLELYRRAHQLMQTELKSRLSDSKVSEDSNQGDITHPLSWSQADYQTLILASIVEKESGQFADQRRIARVFLNRLSQNMRLQSDPTVIYALGSSFTGDLTRADLKIDSPYNTYREKGLPPTPIANPGKQAIAAVLSPDTGSWLYFVGRGDGSSEFSTSLKAHNLAVRKYQLGIE